MTSNQWVSIKKVKVVEPFLLELTLTDDKKVLRDFSAFAKKGTRGVLKPLSNPNFFAKVKVSLGTLEWPGELDLCPDVIIWGKRGTLTTKKNPPARAAFPLMSSK